MKKPFSFGKSEDVKEGCEAPISSSEHEEYEGYTIRPKFKVGKYLQNGTQFYIADLSKKRIYSSDDLRISEINEKLERKDTFIFVEE